MSRPPLPIGNWGRISRTETPAGSGRWRATARFRGFDGRTRQREAWGPSAAKAEQRLVAAMRECTTPRSLEITAQTHLFVLAELWLKDLDQANRLRAQTLDAYTAVAHSLIVPRIGTLTVGSATVSRLDRFFTTLAQDKPGRVRHAHAVLSGMFAMAVRYGALAANPVRQLGPVATPSKPARVLRFEELLVLRRAIQTWQHAHTRRRNTDLLDVVDVMAGTGARIGEVLALRWCDLNLDAKGPSATINGTLAQLRGKGLTWQQHLRSATGRRTVCLPRCTRETLTRVQSRAQPNPHNVVFPSSTGTLRSPANFRRQWREARADAGFDWVTPEAFSKAAAAMLDFEPPSASAPRAAGPIRTEQPNDRRAS